MSRGSKRKHESCVDRFRPILGESVYSERRSTKAVTDELQRQITALQATLGSMSDAKSAPVPDKAETAARGTIPDGHPLQDFGTACLVSGKQWSRVPCGKIRQLYLKFHETNGDGTKPLNHIHFSRLLREIWPTEGCAARRVYTGLEVNPQFQSSSARVNTRPTGCTSGEAE
jgi:hypothetical protein